MTDRILVVDDEQEVREQLSRYLQLKGFRVVTAPNGAQALSLAGELKPEMMISDVDMPDMSGLELTRVLRKTQAGAAIPVLLMSGKMIEDKHLIAGLDGGADDYILKPVSLPVLLARVHALLRRYNAETNGHGKIEACGITLDAERRTVHAGKTEVKLTRKEFDLLEALLGAGGRVLSPQHLLEQVWGYDLTLYNDPHTVEVHISRLRGKLGGKGKHIARVPGVGFKMEL